MESCPEFHWLGGWLGFVKTAFDWREIPPPGTAELASDDVEVWLFRQQLGRQLGHEGPRHLSTDEIGRMESMAAVPGRQFAGTRIVTRRLLSAYLGARPRDVEIRLAPRGKPHLAGEHAETGIRFNVSHSADWAVVAIGRSRLGIDIETHRRPRDVDRLAERFFTSGEALALRRVPREQRQFAFLACWTRKEAYSKALGDGIAMTLKSFETAVTPTRGAVLLTTDGRPDPEWTIRQFRPKPNLACALAVHLPDCTLTCWEIPVGAIESGVL